MAEHPDQFQARLRQPLFDSFRPNQLDLPFLHGSIGIVDLDPGCSAVKAEDPEALTAARRKPVGIGQLERQPPFCIKLACGAGV